MLRILVMWLTFIVSVTVMPCMMGSTGHSKITRAQLHLATLEEALDIYKRKRGHFPTEQEGLEALLGVAMIRLPHDPWGYHYMYRASEGRAGYLLYSVGVDGRDDRGAGDDVTTTPKRYRCEDYGVNCPPTLRDLTAYGSAIVAVVSLILAIAFTVAALYQWLRLLVVGRR